MKTLPFTAFVGLKDLKEALMIIAVDTSISGLLIMGPKGTGKSSIVRAFVNLLPEIEVVDGCPYNDDPRKPSELCNRCKKILEEKGELPVVKRRMRVVDLPIGATEDMVIGSLNLEKTLKKGTVVFEPGILAKANRNILYIDEVNLLPDHIVDSILDAAASGWNIVEREGVSLKHPAKFILIGTMNPEEGELRPQLLDRFAISVKVDTIRDPLLRKEIVRRNVEFENSPEEFYEKWKEEEEKVRRMIEGARKTLNKVVVPEDVLDLIVNTCAKLEVDGYRPDIIATKVARARAALYGRLKATEEDALIGLKLALLHRTRAGGLKPPPTPEEIMKVAGSKSKREQLSPLAVRDIDSKKKERRVRIPRLIFFLSTLKDSLDIRKGKVNPYVVYSIYCICLLLLLYLLLYDYRLALLAIIIAALINMLMSRKRIYSSGYLVKASDRGLIVSYDKSISSGNNMVSKISAGFRLLPKSLHPSLLMELAVDMKSKRARSLGRRKLKSPSRVVDYKRPHRGIVRDISWIASLRRAARRGSLDLDWESIRENLREGRGSISMIVVLDSSASMIYSIKELKMAINAIRRKALKYRDRVSLIVCKGFGSAVLQHPTTSFNIFLQKLSTIGLGDYTPLPSGMYEGYKMALKERKRGYIPLLIIISDGNVNVSLGRPLPSHVRVYHVDKAFSDALSVANLISKAGIDTVLINTKHREDLASGIGEVVTGTELMIAMAKIMKSVYVATKG